MLVESPDLPDIEAGRLPDRQTTQVVSLDQYTWVAVKITVPFLGPLKTRCRTTPGTQKGTIHNFDNHPYMDTYICKLHVVLLLVRMNFLGPLFWDPDLVPQFGIWYSMYMYAHIHMCVYIIYTHIHTHIHIHACIHVKT